MMKVSGNAAAADFFAKHGGSHLLAPSTEGKIKYTSHAALGYKEELKKRLVSDASPGQISDPVLFPGLRSANAIDTQSIALESQSGRGAEEDDFFDEWEEPAAKQSRKAGTAPAKSVVPKSSTPSSAVSLPSSIASSARPDSPASVVDAPGAVSVGRTASPSLGVPSPVSSSSLRPSSRNSTLGAVRSGASTPTGSGPSATGSKLGGVKRGGLGAKKGGAAIDFEAAEKKAREEEQAKASAALQAQVQREADKQAEEMAKQAVRAVAAQAQQQQRQQSSASATPQSPVGRGGASSKSKMTGEVDRLGMGFGRIAVRQGQLQDQMDRERQAQVAARSAADAQMPDYARSKFASQKSISSDQYFERGGYDSNLSAEAKERLAGLQGATSISSNQYFGRDEPGEDEEGTGGGYGGGSSGAGGGTGDGDWANDLESQARELYGRLMANPDVQSGIESFRSGAMKLSQYLEEMSRNGG